MTGEEGGERLAEGKEEESIGSREGLPLQGEPIAEPQRGVDGKERRGRGLSNDGPEGGREETLEGTLLVLFF